MSTCTFCGHRDADERIYPVLLESIETLVEQHGIDTFYVGNQGKFDQMSIRALIEIKRMYPSISGTVVLAYLPLEKHSIEISDILDTLVPDGIEVVPRRFAIVYRNRWMVQHSQYLICEVSHNWGGAAQMLKYAEKCRLNIYRLPVDR